MDMRGHFKTREERKKWKKGEKKEKKKRDRTRQRIGDSLFCCCTASMEQATDGAETAAIDGLVSS